MTINNVLQHYYDKWCSAESRSSLWMSPHVENDDAGGIESASIIVEKHKRSFQKTGKSPNV